MSSEQAPPITLSAADEIVEALEHPDLLPHRAADSSTGSTMRLRASMARFSGPEEHPARRAAVVDAIRTVHTERAYQLTHELVKARLSGAPLDAVEIAFTIPTEVVAAGLGLDVPVDELVADVLAVVRVIGRGEPASAESDAATDRLLAACGNHPAGAVPVVSVLCQNFDATAARTTTILAGQATMTRAAEAVPRTRRVAAVDTTVAGRTVDAGDEIVLEIASAGLPWGAGSHACPGQRLSEAITAGILVGVAWAGYRIDPTGIVTDADGRPTALPMAPDPG